MSDRTHGRIFMEKEKTASNSNADPDPDPDLDSNPDPDPEPGPEPYPHPHPHLTLILTYPNSVAEHQALLRFFKDECHELSHGHEPITKTRFFFLLLFSSIFLILQVWISKIK